MSTPPPVYTPKVCGYTQAGGGATPPLVHCRRNKLLGSIIVYIYKIALMSKDKGRGN